jgi:hypothetical protein
MPVFESHRIAARRECGAVGKTATALPKYLFAVGARWLVSALRVMCLPMSVLDLRYFLEFKRGFSVRCVPFFEVSPIQSCLMLFSVADHRSFKRMSRDEEPA